MHRYNVPDQSCVYGRLVSDRFTNGTDLSLKSLARVSHQKVSNGLVLLLSEKGFKPARVGSFCIAMGATMFVPRDADDIAMIRKLFESGYTGEAI